MHGTAECMPHASWPPLLLSWQAVSFKPNFSASITFALSPKRNATTAGLQVVDAMSGQSFRLLALAKGVVVGTDREALSCMTQEQLESHAQSFKLLGLLVLSNHLKHDSKDTISQLQQQ